MIKLGLSIFEDDKDDDNDMPPLDEAAAEEVDAGKMEEVDWAPIIWRKGKFPN